MIRLITDNELTLLKVLFLRYMEEQDSEYTTTQELANIPQQTITQFVPWLDTYLNINSGADDCEDLNIPTETVEGLKTKLDENPAILATCWMELLFANRPPPIDPPRYLHANFILQWEDGRRLPFIQVVDLVRSKMTITDGAIFRMMNQQMISLLSLITQKTIDVWADRAKSMDYVGPPGSPEIYDVFCGMITEIANKIRPELHGPLANYLTLFRLLIAPGDYFSAQVKNHQAITIRPKDASEKGNQPDKKPAQGGWDV